MAEAVAERDALSAALRARRVADTNLEARLEAAQSQMMKHQELFRTTISEATAATTAAVEAAASATMAINALQQRPRRTHSQAWHDRKLYRAQADRQRQHDGAPRLSQTMASTSRIVMCTGCFKGQPGQYCPNGYCHLCCTQWGNSYCEQHHGA